MFAGLREQSISIGTNLRHQHVNNLKFQGQLLLLLFLVITFSLFLSGPSLEILLLITQLEGTENSYYLEGLALSFFDFYKR